MENTRTKDLTTGSPLKLLLKFMTPILIGILFQQLYYVVDTMIVGQVLGAEALAGVGATGSINFLIIGSIFGVCNGFSIPIAQKFGEKDIGGLKRFLGNIIWLTAAIAVGLTVTVCLLCGSILTWMKTPAETFHYSYTYIFIIFLGIPATMLYNILSGVISALGDSKTPLYFLILSSVINIVLDVALTMGIKLGVAGAALATVLSQLISGLLCLYYFRKKNTFLKLSKEDRKIRKAESLKLLSMGLPMGFETSIVALGVIVMQSAINALGTTIMAATTASERVVGLLSCPLNAVCTAATVYVGQNVGARKMNRVYAGIVSMFLLGCAYCVIALVLAVFWCDNMTMIFINPNEPAFQEIVAASHTYNMASIRYFVFLLCIYLLRSAIQGMGFSKLAVFSGILEMLVRIGLVLFIVPKWGYIAICYANFLSWVMASAFLIPMFIFGVRHLKKKQMREGKTVL